MKSIRRDIGVTTHEIFNWPRNRAFCKYAFVMNGEMPYSILVAITENSCLRVSQMAIANPTSERSSLQCAISKHKLFKRITNGILSEIENTLRA